MSDEPSRRYERILVPTDGSEQSERAADHALEIARQFGGTVHAIYVVDERGPRPSVGNLSPHSPERKEMEERREEAGNELTAAITERAREAVWTRTARSSTAIRPTRSRSTPGRTTLDLIVIGARGRSAVGKFLLGNVAGKVSRHATTPVMLVRADE